MTLELNYDCKTITVKDKINLKEFIKEVKKLGLDLKEWNVVSETIWSSYPIITYPSYPYYHTTLITQANDYNTVNTCDTITLVN